MSAKKKEIREHFRNACLIRDKHKCVFCDIREDLDVHHITDRNKIPNGGYVKENGITLCSEHHRQAEAYHASEGALWYPGMRPEDLYKKIVSQCLIVKKL